MHTVGPGTVQNVLNEPFRGKSQKSVQAKIVFSCCCFNFKKSGVFEYSFGSPSFGVIRLDWCPIHHQFQNFLKKYLIHSTGLDSNCDLHSTTEVTGSKSSTTLVFVLCFEYCLYIRHCSFINDHLIRSWMSGHITSYRSR